MIFRSDDMSHETETGVNQTNLDDNCSILNVATKEKPQKKGKLSSLAFSSNPFFCVMAAAYGR